MLSNNSYGIGTPVQTNTQVKETSIKCIRYLHSLDSWPYLTCTSMIISLSYVPVLFTKFLFFHKMLAKDFVHWIIDAQYQHKRRQNAYYITQRFHTLLMLQFYNDILKLLWMRDVSGTFFKSSSQNKVQISS